MTFSAADLYDQHPNDLLVCEVQFRSFGRRLSFKGPCATLAVFEDHTPVLQCLSQPGNGRVLVVDAGQSLRVAVMGDRLAGKGVANGWTGMIVYGAIRDTVAIDELDFGVKALGTTARRGWCQTQGIFGSILNFGGVRFEPGDWVYADVDAVMVSKRELGARDTVTGE